MRRRHGVNLKSRLLCPECCDVISVSAIEDNGVITLDCGHHRGEILPVTKGHLSIEHLRTAAGRTAFPPGCQDDITARPEFVQWKPGK